ncbi:MAG: winged helix DNA-binding domain-containing protein [Dysgonomonas sp.]
MAINIRMLNQQLANPAFDSPKDLVAWMGAVQAQDYNMVKWAVGVRLGSGNLADVNAALKKGDILRTHMMRPTWHLVSTGDIRWIVQLTGGRIKRNYLTWAKSRGLSEDFYVKYLGLLEKLLDEKNVTKQEISSEFAKMKLPNDTPFLNLLLACAEADGIVCSGEDKGSKPTYALLEQRVPPSKALNKDEALARLATMYFRSHSPATLHDFAWWSGLPLGEARRAMDAIKNDLTKDVFNGSEMYVYGSPVVSQTDKKDVLHLLPSYDEYLISYKDRTPAFDKKHHPKAFTNYGIFYPVVLYNGEIIGNWKKSIKKGEMEFDISFFEKNTKVDKKLLDEAKLRYENFILNK